MPNNTPISDLLDSLRSISGEYPKTTIAALFARRSESVPAMLDVFRDRVELYKDVALRDEQMPFFALYILAQMRETALCPLLLDVLRYPFEDDGDLDEFWGDILFEDVPSILLSVYDGNLQALAALALDRDVMRAIRFVALQTIGLLYAHGEVEREAFFAVLRKVYAQEKNSKEEYDYVLTGFCSLVFDLQLHEFAEEAKLLIRNQLKDFAKPGDLDEALRGDAKNVRAMFMQVPVHQKIQDVEQSTEWWVSQVLEPNSDEI